MLNAEGSRLPSIHETWGFFVYFCSDEKLVSRDFAIYQPIEFGNLALKVRKGEVITIGASWVIFSFTTAGDLLTWDID